MHFVKKQTFYLLFLASFLLLRTPHKGFTLTGQSQQPAPHTTPPQVGRRALILGENIGYVHAPRAPAGNRPSPAHDLPTHESIQSCLSVLHIGDSLTHHNIEQRLTVCHRRSWDLLQVLLPVVKAGPVEEYLVSHRERPLELAQALHVRLCFPAQRARHNPFQPPRLPPDGIPRGRLVFP